MATSRQEIQEFLSENHSAYDIRLFFLDNFGEEALINMAIALREHADAIIAIRSEVKELVSLN